MSEVFTGALADLALDPTLIMLGAFCVFLVGAAAGFAARDALRRQHLAHDDAGDTHAQLPDSRTANSAVLERDVQELLRRANKPTPAPRPRLRAVSGPPLKPSYDGAAAPTARDVCPTCRGVRGSILGLPGRSPLRCTCPT